MEVPAQAIAQHADAIADGHLQLVPPDEAAGDVFSALLACQEDWIVLATASLWHQPHRLAMVQRQLIREPQRDLQHGDRPDRAGAQAAAQEPGRPASS